MPYDLYGRWYPGYEGAVSFGEQEMWGLGPANEEDGEVRHTYRVGSPYGPPRWARRRYRGEYPGFEARPRAPLPGAVPPAGPYHYPYYGYGYTGYGQFGGGYGAQAEHIIYSNGGPYAGVGPRGYLRSDERIEDDVNETLTQDPWLDATDIEVTVENGVVTLSGTVDSVGARRRAAEDARHVIGVRDVRNVLGVRVEGRGRTPRR